MDGYELRRERTLVPAPAVGLYRRDALPMETYLRLDALSASTLKDVLEQGPEFASRARRIVQGETEATERGTALHASILEPEDFELRYGPLPVGCNLNRTDGREAKAAIVASGKKPISAALWEGCQRLRERAWANPMLAALLEQAETEVTAVWETGIGGLMGKGRADVLAADAGVILDFKSSEDVSPFAFGRTAADHGFHLSSPWYTDGFTAAGQPIREWVVGALGYNPKVGHYDVALYVLPRSAVTLGRARYRRALEAWARHEMHPAPSNFPPNFVPLPMPAWALRETPEE